MMTSLTKEGEVQIEAFNVMNMKVTEIAQRIGLQKSTIMLYFLRSERSGDSTVRQLVKMVMNHDSSRLVQSALSGNAGIEK